MVRAGIFIGVDQTGELQKLNDAAAGAKRMHEWALRQGMPDKTHAKLITDAGGRKVRPDEIADAIEAICNGAGVDQLIVYFAGHGINLQHSDRWLLSEAPARTYAAVNVVGSVELARLCGIPHVVIISDACRVAPEGIQNQNVQGVEIFPNTSGGDKTKPVDQFVACYLGRTAAEVAATADDAANYSALYTDALLDALSGTRTDVLEAGDSGDPALYVKPWRLQDYLEAEIPRRVVALKLQKKVNQNPDAIITSRTGWLARIDRPPGATRSRGGPPAPTPGAPLAPQPAPPRTLRSVSRDLTSTASAGTPNTVAAALEQAAHSGIPGAQQFAESVERVARPFGPEHFETQCGIKVRGARVLEHIAPLANGELFDNGSLLRISSLDGPGVSVLLRTAHGTACVVPVIQGFLSALTFDQGDLVDVAFEPSDNTGRWADYKARAADVRALRAIASAASRHGRFHLDGRDAERVGQQMQYAKGIDPALAVYAAYAYHDLQLVDRIADMSGYLRSDVGVTFFDLELLSRRLIDKAIERTSMIVPFVPLLAQGWALLRAHRVKLRPTVDKIDGYVRDSLWTQFDERAIDALAQTMMTKEVR